MDLKSTLEREIQGENGKTPPASAAELPPKTLWNIEDSDKLYRISSWGEPYFGINSAGHITVSPKGDRGGALDLFELVEAIKERNIGLPLLLRFTDILEDRIARLNACFAKAIARYKYNNIYRGVFPVKCNQDRNLIEDLVKFGKPQIGRAHV